MDIFINQQLFSFDSEVSLIEALEKFKAIPPFAILLNDEFLPQSEHKSTFLKDNDKIDVVGAIQGG